ncbi:DUF2007 domain-containing protein [Sphingomicrobium astaxanthinifaciens]|uniref:putative signal transducing protein n=1 Tax=Sphingomicrobium astaxanthinifaciens TaxID=1227949 RepID=UPI001FCB60B3|nr:DUF2007 domain-containing protein [Sphingomicrobium astaxanthinifaciens]MCJ7421236.1 DUF2007 domain-containing protein [Sphingomicrobium astaxanthinifaciens]
MSLVEAARYSTRVEGDLARHRLEAENIPAMIFDTGLNNVFGGAGLAWVRLMVDESDLAVARDILSSPPDAVAVEDD